MHPKSFVSNFWGAVQCDVAPLFMCFIVRLYHPRRSVQTSASVDADIRIVRRRHPHRSTQTSASVGADIRIGRRRHPHRSAQMLFPMIANHRRVWHPCHTHAAISTPSARSHLHAVTPTQPHIRSHIISRLRGECVSKLQNRGGGLTVGGGRVKTPDINNKKLVVRSYMDVQRVFVFLQKRAL